MKKRLVTLNLLASSVLVLALYLNFVHKDAALPEFQGDDFQTALAGGPDVTKPVQDAVKSSESFTRGQVTQQAISPK